MWSRKNYNNERNRFVGAFSLHFCQVRKRRQHPDERMLASIERTRAGRRENRKIINKLFIIIIIIIIVIFTAMEATEFNPACFAYNSVEYRYKTTRSDFSTYAPDFIRNPLFLLWLRRFLSSVAFSTIETINNIADGEVWLYLLF